MDLDSASLYAEIEAFLRETHCEQAERECNLFSTRAYWHVRPTITTVESSMLAWLSQGPQGLDALARRLERDPATAAEFLEELVAIGLVERCGDCYAITAATRDYLKSVRSL